MINILDVSGTLFVNELKNAKKSKGGIRYTEELKRFAITLHYNSPAAYRFCRY